MSEGGTNGLDEVLSEYRDRKAEEIHRARIKEEVEDEWRADCCSRLTHIVLPVLTEFCERIQQDGHETAIVERLGGYEQPNLTLSFRPTAPEPIHAGASRPLPSKITFSCALSHDIETSAEIHGPSGQVGEGGRVGRVPYDGIDSDWVETQLLRFVKTVLDAN